jgi:hypothetical protein
VGEAPLRDDLSALRRFGAQLLVLRAGPEDLPYSPRLTWVAMALMAAIYPAWMLTLTARSPQPEDLGLWPMLVWTIAPAGAMLGVCALLLRAFALQDRFHQFALALALVHGLAMLALFGSSSARLWVVGPQAEGAFEIAVLLASGLVPVAVLLWYGLAMSHVWARTLDRGYGVGLLMTLVQNAAMWILPFVLLIGFVEASNLFS